MTPRRGKGVPKKYCSERCRLASRRSREGNGPGASGRKRRPLPDAARGAAWSLRKDIERIERIVADDRFTQLQDSAIALLGTMIKPKVNLVLSP